MASLKSRAMRCMLTFGLITALAGCSTTRRDWQNASRLGTIEAYERFLQNHPDSDQAGIARNRMAEVQAEVQAAEGWSKAESMNTIEGYTNFIDEYPQSKQVEQAKQAIEQQEAILLEDAAWESAKQMNSYDGYLEYIQEFPRSSHAREAAREAETQLVLSEARDSFQVIKAISTEDEQPFHGGYILGSTMKAAPTRVGTPMDGDQFVVVDWSLGDFTFRGDEFSLHGSDLVLLAEGEEPDAGYTSWLGLSGAWFSADGYSSLIKPGVTVNGRRLFVVKKAKSDSLRLRFLGKEYPLDIQPG